MPDDTVEDVVFDVIAKNTDTLRESWQKAKARYEPEWRGRGIDFSKGLGPAMDKWAVSYKAFDKTRFALAKGKVLWSKIPVVAQAKIKTEARSLKTEAKAVAKVAAKYLNAIEVLGGPDDKDGNDAKRDLTTILTKIAERAAQHQTQAQKVIDR